MSCTTTDILRVRLMIGDLDALLVTDQVIQLNLSLYQDKTSPLKEYLTAIDSLRYAIFAQAPTGSKRREKEGNVEIEVDGTQTIKSLKNAYEFLLKNPPAGIAKASIIFGGVSVEEYNRVLSNSDRLASEASIGWFDKDVGQGTSYPGYSYVSNDDGF